MRCLVHPPKYSVVTDPGIFYVHEYMYQPNDYPPVKANLALIEPSSLAFCDRLKRPKYCFVLTTAERDPQTNRCVICHRGGVEVHLTILFDKELLGPKNDICRCVHTKHLLVFLSL